MTRGEAARAAAALNTRVRQAEDWFRSLPPGSREMNATEIRFAQRLLKQSRGNLELFERLNSHATANGVGPIRRYLDSTGNTTAVAKAIKRHANFRQSTDTFALWLSFMGEFPRASVPAEQERNVFANLSAFPEPTLDPAPDAAPPYEARGPLPGYDPPPD